MSDFQDPDPASLEQSVKALAAYKISEAIGRYCAGALLVIYLYEILLTCDEEVRAAVLTFWQSTHWFWQVRLVFPMQWGFMKAVWIWVCRVILSERPPGGAFADR